MILAQLTDLHVRPPGKPAYRVVETTLLAERALRAIARLRPRPDALVISGDLTDNGLASEYAVLAALLRRHVADLPVYMVPGNHDRRDRMRLDLAAWPGIAAHPSFIQYAVEDLPVRLLMLDSVVPGEGYGSLCAQRLAWLDDALAAAPHRPTMLVLHHPPIRCGMALLDSIALRAPGELAQVLARHPQVDRILCGHHHRPITGRLGAALVVVASAATHQSEFDLAQDQGRMMLEPPGFMLHVQVEDGSIASHAVLVEDFPGPFPYIEDPDYPGRRESSGTQSPPGAS